MFKLFMALNFDFGKLGWHDRDEKNER